jgi:hypothetical protein
VLQRCLTLTGDPPLAEPERSQPQAAFANFGSSTGSSHHGTGTRSSPILYAAYSIHYALTYYALTYYALIHYALTMHTLCTHYAYTMHSLCRYDLLLGRAWQQHERGTVCSVSTVPPFLMCPDRHQVLRSVNLDKHNKATARRASATAAAAAHSGAAHNGADSSGGADSDPPPVESMYDWTAGRII